MAEANVNELLGRVPPPDQAHVEKYPLTLARATAIPPTSVVLGIGWPRSFFTPEKVGKQWWVGRGDPSTWGPEEGGHAIATEPKDPMFDDCAAWWPFYEQQRGDCVGYSTARSLSLLNRRRYDGAWIYDRCKERDGYPGEGTYLRVGFDVLLELGPVVVRGATRRGPVLAESIREFRWARNVEEILRALGLPLDAGYVTLLNSWGRQFPRRVRMPVETLDVLVFDRGGEAGVVTDRVE